MEFKPDEFEPLEFKPDEFEPLEFKPEFEPLEFKPDEFEPEPVVSDDILIKTNIHYNPLYKNGEEIQFYWSGYWYIGEVKTSYIDPNNQENRYYDIYFWIRDSTRWSEHKQKKTPSNFIRHKKGTYKKNSLVDVLYTDGYAPKWYSAVITKDDDHSDPHPNIEFINKSYGKLKGIDPRKVRFYN